MDTIKEQDCKSLKTPSRQPVLQDMKWVEFIPAIIAAGLMLYMYVPVFGRWYEAWMAEESYYSHGILVPVISAFIVWLKRKQIAELPVRPDTLGYLFVVPSLLVMLVMTRAGASNPQGLVLPVLIAGMSLLLLGRRITLALWFPIAFLFFMCVLPGDILTKLSFRIQILSTAGATVMLKALTLEAMRQGAAIHLPNIEVLVGAPCSGFRLLISLFAFSSLFAYLKEGPLWGRLGLVAVTLPLSLIVNSIRISLIALVGEFFGEDAMHGFHDYSGYLVLILAFIALWYLARLFKCRNFNSMLLS